MKKRLNSKERERIISHTSSYYFIIILNLSTKVYLLIHENLKSQKTSFINCSSQSIITYKYHKILSEGKVKSPQYKKYKQQKSNWNVAPLIRLINNKCITTWLQDSFYPFPQENFLVKIINNLFPYLQLQNLHSEHK